MEQGLEAAALGKSDPYADFEVCKLIELHVEKSRYDLQVTLYGNSIFAVGGRCGKQPVGAVESFDIELNQWTSWMNIPSPTALPSFGCSRGMMVVAAGLKVSKVRFSPIYGR